MNFEEVLGLALLAGWVWFWVDSLGARERALAVCARACADSQVQFLDQTVALKRLRLGRHADGRMRLRRLYAFEFSTDGANRRRGSAELLGRRVVALSLDMPEGNTFLSSAP